MNRRYFIIELPNQNMIQALEVCIGIAETQRYSLDNSKLFVKTNQNLIDEKQQSFDIENLLNSQFVTEYTLEEVKTILNNSDWQNDELI